MKKISCSIAFLAISFQMGFAQTVITEKNGNVGIGTTDPQRKLHVNGDILGGTVLSFQDDARFNVSKNDIPELRDVNFSMPHYGMAAPSVTGAAQLWLSGAAGIRMFTLGNPNPTMTLWGNRVGIGTKEPYTALDVTNDNANLASVVFKNPDKAMGLYIYPGYKFQDYKQTKEYNTVTLMGSGAEYGNLAFGTGHAEVMRISANQNVGIGTTTPSAKLDITLASETLPAFAVKNPDRGMGLFVLPGNKLNGSGFSKEYNTTTITSSGNEYGNLALGTGHAEVLRISSNQNVGIGTTDPQTKLDVNGTVSIADGSSFQIRGADPHHGLKYKRTYPNDQLLDGPFLYGWYGGSLGIKKSATEESHVLNWTQNGNVGIGVTNPGTKLQVGDFAQQNTLKITGSVESNKAPVLSFYRLGSSESIIAQYGSNMIFANTTGNSNYSDDNLKNIANMTITLSGKVGIGTLNPDEKLTVKGKIHAEEVIIDNQVPADYVFQKHYTGSSSLKADYQMPSLSEVEAYTKANHHLPGLPSAKEQQEKGVQLGEMTNLLLQKIEELTLYSIEQQKRIEALEQKLKNK